MRQLLVYRYLLILMLVVGGFGITKAQQPTYSFQSKLSADSILIGDRVELMIQVSLPKGYNVQFPFFADSIVKGIEIIGKPTIDTIAKGSDLMEYIYRQNLTSFDQGYYRIPPFKLPFSSNQVSDTARTTPLWILVNSLPIDTTKAPIYDIKLPYSEPLTFAEVAPWVAGGLLLAGIIALLVIYLIKRKKNEPIFFARKPVEPPHVIALRELEKIKEKKLWINDTPKHYHTALTDVLRNYIEGRFRIQAMEQTTEETLRNLKSENCVDIKLLEGLSEVLTLADLVKFARFTPTISENEAGLQFGFRFVNETKVEVVVEPTTNGEENKAQGIVNIDTSHDSSSELPIESVKPN